MSAINSSVRSSFLLHDRRHSSGCAVRNIIFLKKVDEIRMKMIWYDPGLETETNIRTTLLTSTTATTNGPDDKSGARRKMWGEDGNDARLLS